MKIFLKLLAILLLPLLLKSSEITSNEWCSTREMDSQCGFYCYEVVKPLLQYASSVQSKQQQFAELQAKIQLLEATENNLNDAVKQKDFQLKQQIELTNTHKKINQIQESLLSARPKQLTSNEAQIDKLQIDIQSKDNEIEHLKSQIKGKDSQLSLKTDKIKQLESKFSECQKASKPSSCLDKLTGVYTIQVADTFAVPCDSDMAGSGWTVIQRRIDGKVDFNRNWSEYKAGFGHLLGEFFIGLEKLYLLTKSQPHELYIHLVDYEKQTRYARYSHFLIGDESEAYELKSLGDYSGTAGNSLKHHINMKFSTPDRDNDISTDNVAEIFQSGWWFQDWLNCNLNGIRATKDVGKGEPRICWNDWKFEALNSVQMMIRPINN